MERGQVGKGGKGFWWKENKDQVEKELLKGVKERQCRER